MAVSWYLTTQIISDLSVILAHGNYARTDNIKSQESWRDYFTFGADAPDVYNMRWFEHLFTENDGASLIFFFFLIEQFYFFWIERVGSYVRTN